MSTSRPHFEAAPLVEAVFDCFAEPGAGAASVTQLEEQFFAQRPEYAAATREDWHQATSRVALRRGMPAAAPITTELAGARRWTESRGRGVLVGPAVLALNIKPPYGHFEDHLPHLRELFELFLKTAAPQRIQWLGHRYVNQVEIGLDEGVTAADLFTLYPRVPDARAKAHPPLAVQMEAARFDGGVVMTTLGLAAKQQDKAIYSLDIYARTDREVEPTSSSMARWHVDAHQFIMDAFLGSITATARRRFKEATP